MKRILFAVVAALPMLWAASSIAAVTPDDASLLKSKLTPLGGERAGNADGSIPAWTGGYTTVPPGYKSGDARPDPFSADKPVTTITRGNLDKYSAKLPQGALELFKRNADFRMVIYPTRRDLRRGAPVRVRQYICQRDEGQAYREWERGRGCIWRYTVPDSEERKRGGLESPSALGRVCVRCRVGRLGRGGRWGNRACRAPRWLRAVSLLRPEADGY